MNQINQSSPEGEAPDPGYGYIPPTQTAHPWRATARTLFAALVALAAMFPLLVDASGLEETSGPIAGALAIAGGITRIMAIPAVNDFLERFVPFLAAEGNDR